MDAPKYPSLLFPVTPVRGESGQAVTPAPAAVAAAVPSPLSAARCREKGCIFPVSAEGETTCALHQLAEQEPKLFLSLQPSSFLLEQAKFVLPDREFDYSRARDRHRLAALREQALEEVA